MIYLGTGWSLPLPRKKQENKKHKITNYVLVFQCGARAEDSPATPTGNRSIAPDCSGQGRDRGQKMSGLQQGRWEEEAGREHGGYLRHKAAFAISHGGSLKGNVGMGPNTI